MLWITRYGQEGQRPLARMISPIRRWGVAKLVRRLTLDQEIIGSNPISPANRLRRSASAGSRVVGGAKRHASAGSRGPTRPRSAGPSLCAFQFHRETAIFTPRQNRVRGWLDDLEDLNRTVGGRCWRGWGSCPGHRRGRLVEPIPGLVLDPGLSAQDFSDAGSEV